MTRNQRITAFVFGAIAIMMISHALLPNDETPDAPPPTNAETVIAIRKAVDYCEIGFGNIRRAMANIDDPSIVHPYEAARRATNICNASYLELGKLGPSDAARACTEEASIKGWAAKRAMKAFEERLTGKLMSEMQDAFSEVPAAELACAAALEAAEAAAGKPAAPAKE
jgi:hypothetical protein